MQTLVSGGKVLLITHPTPMLPPDPPLALLQEVTQEGGNYRSKTRIALSRAHNSIKPKPISNSTALYHSEFKTTQNCLTIV